MNCRSERCFAGNESIKVIIEHFSDRWLHWQTFRVQSRGIGPLDVVGQLNGGDAPLGIDLKARRRQEPSRLAPGRAMVATERNLGGSAVVEGEREDFKIRAAVGVDILSIRQHHPGARCTLRGTVPNRKQHQSSR